MQELPVGEQAKLAVWPERNDCPLARMKELP